MICFMWQEKEGLMSSEGHKMLLISVHQTRIYHHHHHHSAGHWISLDSNPQWMLQRKHRGTNIIHRGCNLTTSSYLRINTAMIKPVQCGRWCSSRWSVKTSVLFFSTMCSNILFRKLFLKSLEAVSIFKLFLKKELLHVKLCTHFFCAELQRLI